MKTKHVTCVILKYCIVKNKKIILFTSDTCECYEKTIQNLCNYEIMKTKHPNQISRENIPSLPVLTQNKSKARCRLETAVLVKTGK